MRSWRAFPCRFVVDVVVSDMLRLSALIGLLLVTFFTFVSTSGVPGLATFDAQTALGVAPLFPASPSVVDLPPIIVGCTYHHTNTSDGDFETEEDAEISAAHPHADHNLSYVTVESKMHHRRASHHHDKSSSYAESLMWVAWFVSVAFLTLVCGLFFDFLLFL